ncbi:hypothetical protein BKA70DRAFT_369886 [Coprinopsis sp. MPI-PUGE-AT-0042]|nr:hypothetical protein BKA70DRAFT_369886 [Coprinopsis sp. MPI-PUGE-AT-0042]
MLSFNHPRRSPFIRLVQFTPNNMDTGAVKPFLGQLAEMESTEAGMGQRICAEISPRSQQPSLVLEKTIASKPSMAPGRLTTPGRFVTIASSPYPPGRSSTCLQISRLMREEHYPAILLLEARNAPQHSDYTSENLFRMTTSTVTTTTTVVPNSFPIDGQVIVLDHKTSCPILAQGPTTSGSYVLGVGIARIYHR